MRPSETWIALAVMALAAPAAAEPARAPDKPPDKEACVAAFDRGQRAQSDRSLRRAQTELIVCSQETCPNVLRADCAGVLAEVRSALPTIVFAADDGNGFNLNIVRDQMRRGVFGMLISVQGWNGQPDDPNVIVGFQLSDGAEGTQIDTDAGRPLPKFDGSDVWTVQPGSVLGGGDLKGTDCRTLAAACSPAAADAMAYVRDGVVVAHLDIPLPLQTSTGTFTIDFLDAMLTAKLTLENGVQHATGEISGRWPVERLLAGFARVHNPQTDIALCASDAGLEIYKLLKTSVCESADLASTRGLDRTAARCEALSNSFSFMGVKATLGTIYKGDRVEPNDCPDFIDRCD